MAKPNTTKTPNPPHGKGSKSNGGYSWVQLSTIPVGIAILVSLFRTYSSPTTTRPFEGNLPTVKIAQGTIVGRMVDDGTFPEPLEGFMGIPYALPPVGNLRFREAVPVPDGNGTLEAFYLGARCPGKQVTPFLPDDGIGPDFESEDCLTVNIWRPKGYHHHHSPGSPNKKLLPVGVLIPGGAFNRGAARMHNTHSMLAHSAEPWLAVSMQYRIGVFGGLNTELTAKEGLLNLGLKDIYLALEWVQKNIAAFGGDPDDVTVMGLSAAAHAIGHLIMDVNQPKKLYHKAIMDSGAHTARAVHPPDAKLNTQHFREFLDLTPCGKEHASDLLNPAILDCLRDLPSEVVDAAGKEIYARSDPSVRWAWQPVIDGKIISRRPLDAWRSGRFSRVPILTGSTHNEGSMYVPRTANASAEFREFFHVLLPQLSSADLDQLEKLYPDPEKDPDTSPYVETSGNPSLGAQFRRIEQAYGHYAYTCPVRQTAHWATKKKTVAADSAPPVFLYHWALNKTAILGAQHGDQMRYQTYNPEVRSISPAQEEVSGKFHAYCVSFILSGDPNKALKGAGQQQGGVDREARFADRPEWPSWKDGKGLTMLLGEGNDERAGGTGVGVAAAVRDYEWANKECEFWWRMSGKFED